MHSVILEDEKVLAWHKTPTTSDIQKGVELAIEAVIEEAAIPSSRVASVKIGTTVRFTFCLVKFLLRSFYQYSVGQGHLMTALPSPSHQATPQISMQMLRVLGVANFV